MSKETTNDKYNQTMDDDTLDEVAGGNRSEMAKDVAFLKALGLEFDKNPSTDEINVGWKRVGVQDVRIWADDKSNDYAKYHKVSEKCITSKKMSRQDAMIEAMRYTGKIVNLDKYI